MTNLKEAKSTIGTKLDHYYLGPCTFTKEAALLENQNPDPSSFFIYVDEDECIKEVSVNLLSLKEDISTQNRLNAKAVLDSYESIHLHVDFLFPKEAFDIFHFYSEDQPKLNNHLNISIWGFNKEEKFKAYLGRHSNLNTSMLKTAKITNLFIWNDGSTLIQLNKSVRIHLLKEAILVEVEE